MYTKTGWTLFLLSLGGFLFSGYLSVGKLISERCVIDSGCSYFLGYPTCYYGFALFTTLFVFSSITLLKGTRAPRKLLRAITIVAVVGIGFSGLFGVIEIIPMIAKGVRYGFYLPTCVYGLAFYILIALTAWHEWSDTAMEHREPVVGNV